MKRRDFLKRAAWVSTGLIFVPRGHGQIIQAGNQQWSGNLNFGAGSPPVSGGGGGGLTIATVDTKTGAKATNGGNGTTVHTLTGVPAGALLVISGANEFDSSGGAITVADNTTLTWTSQNSAFVANSGNARIYTAVFTAGGSITITVTHAHGSTNDTPARSSVCYVITGQEGTLGGAAPAASTAQDQPNVSITTTRANSLIICICSDFAARAGTPTARLGTIRLNDDVTTASYRGVHITHQATSAAAYGMGYTGANTGGVNKCGVCLLEVRTP